MSENYPKDDRQAHEEPGGARHRLGVLMLALALALAVVSAVALATLTGKGGPKQASTKEVASSQQSAPLEAVDEPAPEPEPAPPEPPHVEPVSVRLMMIGDILMHMGVIASGDMGDGTLNYDHLFSHIAGDVQEADVAVVNQETILGGYNWPFSGYPAFNSPQEVGDAEAAVGFDVILRATNHTFDMGYAGVSSELAFWANNHPEMAVIGAADPDGDGIAPAGGTSPAGPYVFEKDGFRIALLNYTAVLNANVDPSYDEQVMGIMSEDRIRADVEAAHEQADIVVVFAHWGEEYQTSPVESEYYWASVFQDAGVDVVIGGHPHVIQPVEVLGEGDDRMLVFWSVGNFVSTQNDARNMLGGMAKVDFVKDDDGARVTSYEFIPTVTQKEPYTTNMTTYKLPDYNDDLAAQSTVSSWAGEGGTAGWYYDYCAGVLGDAFDWDTATVHGSL